MCLRGGHATQTAFDVDVKFSAGKSYSKMVELVDLFSAFAKLGSG